MIWIISTVLSSLVTIFLLLDFLVKKCTTYNLAKEIPGAYMWPIVGALDFFGSPQRM